MINILLVEDDPVIGRALSMSLPYRGFQVTVSGTIQKGWEFFRSGSFDLALLDVQLPDGSGFELCRRIREENPDFPIVMITAKTDESSAVKGLQDGADDYVRKPFGLDELTARLNRLLGRNEAKKRFIQYRSVRIDLSERKVWVGDREIAFGKREFDILSILARHSGDVVTREEILDSIDDDADLFDRTIDSHLSHVRKKIRTAVGDGIQIVPVYGIGYRLETHAGGP